MSYAKIFVLWYILIYNIYSSNSFELFHKFISYNLRKSLKDASVLMIFSTAVFFPYNIDASAETESHSFSSTEQDNANEWNLPNG